MDGGKPDQKALEAAWIRANSAVQGSQQPEEAVRALGLGKRCIYTWLAAYRSDGLGTGKAK